MDVIVDLGTTMSRFAELTDAAFGDEKVPTCPGWSSADLVQHLGSIHRWAGSILLSGQRLPQPVDVVVTQPASEWYAGVAAALLATLQAVDPAEPTPNFSRIGETAAFWARRQLHETTIHTIDLSLALDLGFEAWPLRPALAIDGIDEVFRVFFPRMTAGGRAPHLSEPVRVRATDTGHTWLLAPSSVPGGPPVVVHDSRPVVAGEVRGRAADLYLALWKRQGLGALDLWGDGTALMTGPTTP